jgi:IS5 family transposase
MDISTFIVNVFTFIDDWFQQQTKPVRQRGSQPVLWDSEVLTVEVVGAFLGLNTDQAIYDYFRRHWADYFPRLTGVHRTTFVRQSANLWLVKERLWQALLSHIDFDPALALIDSMPVPVCRFARASYARRLRDCSTYGHDEVARQKFFGLRAHLVVCWPGVITKLELAPANVAELTVAEQLLAGHSGWVLADRNYWSPNLRARLREHGLRLLAPFRLKRKEAAPWPLWLKHMRFRIETVFGQLVERFDVKRVRTHDRWHFCSRWYRFVLSHTFGVYLCQQYGLPSLRFADLITD